MEFFKKIIWILHKLLFPKYHASLTRAFTISREYMLKSPDPIKRKVGEDIFLHISFRNPPKSSPLRV